MGAVEGTRGIATVYKIKDGTVVQVTKWSLTGLGERALTLFVNADGKLVYISDGEQAMRKQGISLTPPPPPAEPPSSGTIANAFFASAAFLTGDGAAVELPSASTMVAAALAASNCATSAVA